MSGSDKHDDEPQRQATAEYLTTCFIYLFSLFAISWATPAAYGGSQARGQIGAVSAGLHQSHINAGYEPRLPPTPQLTATTDH